MPQCEKKIGGGTAILTTKNSPIPMPHQCTKLFFLVGAKEKLVWGIHKWFGHCLGWQSQCTHSCGPQAVQHGQAMHPSQLCAMPNQLPGQQMPTSVVHLWPPVGCLQGWCYAGEYRTLNVEWFISRHLHPWTECMFTIPASLYPK